MTSNEPQQQLRRGPLYRHHERAGARFDDFSGALCVSQYGDIADEVIQAQHLGLSDLSMLARIGCKGCGAPDWTNRHGAQLPERPNLALTQPDGSLLVRLAEHEVLVLRNLQKSSDLITRLTNDASAAAGQHAYLLPRADSHCWLALTGEHAAQTLAKVCGIDMRLHKFAQGSVAQTSMARVNAIAIRNDLSEVVACFYILCDVSMTEYLWESLLDAMQEFDGRPVGVAALSHLQAA